MRLDFKIAGCSCISTKQRLKVANVGKPDKHPVGNTRSIKLIIQW
jgi:hypothetical protein